MFSIIFGTFTFILFFNFFNYFYYTGSSRFSSILSSVYSFILSMVSPNVGKSLVIFLFFFILIINLTGNIPLNFIPTMFYSFTFTLSLLFWLPLVFSICISQLKDFIAHILPYGSPSGLMLFLPIVEIFSQLIRSLTLIIRLRTNLCAGHIMIYMFSYFTLLSSVLSPFIYVVLSLLFILELCISALQAYIFVSLISLYINETA